ncbi:hypothetical protein ACJRO7_020030 [Eucalyptus globulus]|uniref:Uncharacterized protein n=1 Tax=Eucalyptus globulus TaxID=34317 RepID=A0ABD3KF69_EUCGL
MDPSAGDAASPPPHRGATGESGNLSVLLRLFLALLFPVVFFFSSSFVIGVVALLVSNFSIPSPMSLPAQCKIVSSSVDIRSSKVCELGLLNYNAKIVFSSSEKRKFRCHYDYYWASVFKVEYKDHLSGQTQLALAEAPNEALPADCRPGFGVAWLTKDKFKVNNTYDCWYASSNSKVSIYHDDFFSCQAKDPSAMEMMRRYYILFLEIFKSWVTGKIRAKYWKWETIVGVVTGFSTSLISMSFIRLFQQIKSRHRSHPTGNLPCTVSANRLKRACLFVAYVSFTGWLALQYGKRLGLPLIYIYR